MKTISNDDKERIIDMGYHAVRSGMANGDYLDIDIKIKSIMRDQMASLTFDEQIYLLRDFIGYMRKRIKVPGGRIGVVALINLGRTRRVPDFLVQGATAIWGTLFSSKANSGKLRELILT